MFFAVGFCAGMTALRAAQTATLAAPLRFELAGRGSIGMVASVCTGESGPCVCLCSFVSGFECLLQTLCSLSAGFLRIVHLVNVTGAVLTSVVSAVNLVEHGRDVNLRWTSHHLSSFGWGLASFFCCFSFDRERRLGHGFPQRPVRRNRLLCNTFLVRTFFPRSTTLQLRPVASSRFAAFPAT